MVLSQEPVKWYGVYIHSWAVSDIEKDWNIVVALQVICDVYETFNLASVYMRE